MKWNEWCPPERRHGFDDWYAYGTYDRHLRPMYWDADAARDDFLHVDQWGPEHEADKACGFLRREDPENRPFCLVVSMNPPHTPYGQVPECYRELYQDLDLENSAPSGPAIPRRTGRTPGFFPTASATTTP